MKYHTVHEAKTNLSKLIAKACEGEEVIIARGKKPVVKLVPIASGLRKRVPGGLEGKISWSLMLSIPLPKKRCACSDSKSNNQGHQPPKQPAH